MASERLQFYAIGVVSCGFLGYYLHKGPWWLCLILLINAMVGILNAVVAAVAAARE